MDVTVNGSGRSSSTLRKLSRAWATGFAGIGLLALALCADVSVVLAQDVAPAKPTFELQGNSLKLPSAIVFETGNATLKAESEAALNHVKAYLQEKTYISLMRIEGHTPDLGDANANQALSEQRAKAAADWLVSHGVECKRLLPVGFGGTKPVESNATPEGRARNTRLEFSNAELRGRAIGGMPVDGGGRVVSSWKCATP